MNRHYTKTYGIECGFHKGNPRYFVVCEGKKTSLHYSHSGFALKKAESFIKSLYKPFKDQQGNQVSFSFKLAV